MIFGKIEVINMNFYGSEEYNQLIKELDKLVYTKCNLLKPTNEVELDDEYSIKYYYYKDIDSNKDGEICRLYKDEKMIYEWKNIYNISRYATIIKHSDGNKYLLFSIDLYGYSVLNLKTLECINYIPSESYLDNKETFIWCDVNYNINSNLLVVSGCYWGTPYSLIVLDFTKPMEIVESRNWLNLPSKYYELGCDIDFKCWDDNKLVCMLDENKDSILTIDINELKEE